ncbi:MAG: oligosaccharide flippase family protein [Nanoarchaeota archaeon]
MSYTRLVIRNAIVFVVLGVLSSIVFYLWRLMLAHPLTPYEFGLFFACFSFIGLVTGLKELGTSSAAVKYIAHYCAKRRWALMRETMIWFFLWQLLCFGVAAVGVLVFLKPLATFYFKDPNATSVML